MRNEKTLSRKRGHFKLCQFADDNDQFEILVEQMRGSLLTKPFDVYRNDYLQLLCTLSTSFVADSEMEWSAMTKSSFEWILNNGIYQSWLTSPSPAILHLRGVKGAGKTVIAHFLVDSLRDREGAHGASVASFFFSKHDDRRNKVQTLCVSLAAQLLMTKPTLFRYISEFRTNFSPSVQKSDMNEFRAWTLLRMILCCAGANGVICVINAIHEADTEIMTFLTNLMSVKSAAEAPFKIIVTSTSEDYRETLQSCHELSLDDEENMQQQVMSSITQSVASLLQSKPALKAFEREITAQICDAKPLNLLQAELSLKCLEETRVHSTPISLRSALAPLSESSPEMALRRLVENITPWVLGVLAWMAYAFRPLRLGELATAMAIVDFEASSDPVDDYLARDIKTDLLQTLGSVIRVQHNEVQFVHPSIKEAVRHYMEKECTAVSHRKIALTCLAYISGPRLERAQIILKGFRTASETSLSESDSFSKDYGLLLYAVQYWPAHYRSIEKPSEHDTLRVCRCLEGEDWVRSWSDVDSSTQIPVLNIPSFSTASPAHLGAFLGFEDVVKSQFDATSAEIREELLTIAAAKDRLQVTTYLLDHHPYRSADMSSSLMEASAHRSKSVISNFVERLDLQQQISDIGILLERAASMGHEGLFKAILHTKLREQLTQAHMMRVLCAAAIVGNENAVIEVLDSKLLSQIEDTSHSGGHSLRPLHDAVFSSHEQVVRLIQHFEEENQQANQQDARGRTPLHLACMIGLPKIVRRLTSSAAFPNLISTPDSLGRTPLHYAVFYGHKETVTAIFSLKLNSEIKTRKGRTALHLAVLEQRKTIVDQLPELGATPNASDNHGETPLHAAVAAESLDMVQALVNHKAEVNERSSTGFTPLLLAVQRGSLDIFAFLKNSEAELTTQDDEGLTPLHWASKNGDPDMVHRVLELSADPNVTDKSGLRPVHHAASSGSSHSLKHLLENGAEIESKTPREKTALHLGAEKGNRGCVTMLLSKGANTNQRDWTGQIPLESAADWGNYEIVALILTSNTGEQPIDNTVLEKILHDAALNKCHNVLKELLKTEVNLSSKDDDGDSVITNAVYGGSIEVITTLLEAPGVDVNDARTDRMGPLQVAVMRDGRDIVELLLSHKADTNKSYGKVGTPLHVAIGHANMGLSQLLYEKGADVNGLGGRFETPLQTAVSSGNEETVEFLIRNEGDVKAMGGKWGNVINGAVAKAASPTSPSAWQILEALFRHGASIQDEDQQGRSAIHMTGYSGNLEILKNFLAQDNNGLARKDRQGRTVFHFAAAKGHTDMVSDILGSKDPKDSQWLDRDQWTPLHWACRDENLAVVRLLLDKGFDASAKSSDSWSAIDVAIFHDSRDVLDLFKGEQDKLSDDNNSQPKEAPRDLFSTEGLPLRKARKTSYTCKGCYCVSAPGCKRSVEMILTQTENIWSATPLPKVHQVLFLLQMRLDQRRDPS